VTAPPEAEGERQVGHVAVGLTLRRELMRKGLHLLSVTVPLSYAAGLPRAFVVSGLIVALIVAAAVEITRARSDRVRAVFDGGVGILLREHEWHGVSGATWLVIALLVATACFPRDVAVAAMCAVSLGDASAAIIGRALARAGSGARKSLAGSMACFVASAIAARTIANFTWQETLIVGVLASLAERPRRPLDDNLRIALVVGCGILLWRMGFS
jgi:dolichol kinase